MMVVKYQTLEWFSLNACKADDKLVLIVLGAVQARKEPGPQKWTQSTMDKMLGAKPVVELALAPRLFECIMNLTDHRAMVKFVAQLVR